jgi:hypothetical protein
LKAGYSEIRRLSTCGARFKILNAKKIDEYIPEGFTDGEYIAQGWKTKICPSCDGTGAYRAQGDKMNNEIQTHIETEEEKQARAERWKNYDAEHPETADQKEVREILSKAPNLLAALDGINEIDARRAP